MANTKISALTALTGAGTDSAADLIPIVDTSATTTKNITPTQLLIGMGVTSSAAELNILDGATLTVTELNYVDGVTSAIQTQLDNKQAADAQLTDIAGLTPTDNGVIIGNGANFVVESGATLKTSLGLTIGTDVQAYNADLTDLAAQWKPADATGPATLDFHEDTDNGTNKVVLTGPASITLDKVLYLPDASDTLVGKATTDTLTNKSIDLASNTVTGTKAQFDTACSDGNFAYQSDLASYQPLDSDLTTIAGLTATTDSFIQAKSSAWASRTVAQVTTDLQGTGLTDATVGFRNVPVNSQSAAYTTVAADNGKLILHPSTDANARTFTIDSNANVAYPVGTAITFVNMTSNVVTIAITSDTMYLAGTGTTGSRSLAQYGMATAIKLTSTTWLINGNGLT